MYHQPRKLKRVVIREEYVALTGDYKKAVLLHQLEYLQSKRWDVDQFLAEENARMAKDGIEANVLPADGWFRKTAEGLSKETLLKLSASNIHAHLHFFVERGWLHERFNPKEKWDRTKQYRLDLIRLKRDLEDLGYGLEGWVLAEGESHDTAEKDTFSTLENANSKTENGSSETKDRPSKTKIPTSKTEERYITLNKHEIEHAPKHTAIAALPALERSSPVAPAAAAGVCVSKFSSKERLLYAEHLQKQSREIRNPGGLAKSFENGSMDEVIEEFFAVQYNPQPPQKKMSPDPNCPKCYGYGMEIVPGKGARKCECRGRVPRVRTNSPPEGSSRVINAESQKVSEAEGMMRTLE